MGNILNPNIPFAKKSCRLRQTAGRSAVRLRGEIEEGGRMPGQLRKRHARKLVLQMQQIPRKIPVGQEPPLHHHRNLPALRMFNFSLI